MAGDQQAGLFGQGCFAAGQAKNTYGTGCFLLMNTGETAAMLPDTGLLTTVAMARGGKVTYCLEGSVFIGGAVVQWLRDELHLISTAAETEERALSVPDSCGVVVVPAFTGLGAPYWDMYARGAILGLTRGAGANHVIRAALESIAFQVEDLLAAMKAATPITSLKVNGKTVKLKKNKFTYTVSKFKKTSAIIKVKASKGWKVKGVYADIEYVGYKKLKNGKSFKIPKDGRASVWIDLVNGKKQLFTYRIEINRI